MFSVITAGNEKVIYVFRGNKDGSKPSAGLAKIGNNRRILFRHKRSDPHATSWIDTA